MQPINYPALFADFTGREADLRKVVRYHVFTPMYYRSHLFTHSKRVLWLLQSILPLVETVFKTDFDTTKAQLLAVVHDDPEIVMGDIQSGHKRKLNAAQLAEVERLEQESIATMAERFPYSVLGYRYQDLLSESQEIKTLEAKLLKYIDRFDAFGEALHEVHAGNRAFTIPSVDPELGVIELPVDYYKKYLPAFPENNPEFRALFSFPHPVLTVPTDFIPETVVNQATPHTPASLEQGTDYAPYAAWKKIILNSGDPEEIENLYHQKEHS